MSRASASVGSRKSPGAEAASSGQGLGVGWENRRKSPASLAGKTARMPCPWPGGTPADRPLKEPRGAASRASRPVCGVAGGLRDVLRTDMALPLLGAEPKKPAPVAYLIIRLGAENWLRDEVRSIGPTPRHRRR